MILGLSIVVVALALVTWLTFMYMWWQKEQGAKEVLATEFASSYTEKSVRLIRRGWYRVGMLMEVVSDWVTAKMKKVFFSLFPSAIPAFEKKDQLTGLQTGPLSYYLQSISEKNKGSRLSSK